MRRLAAYALTFVALAALVPPGSLARADGVVAMSQLPAWVQVASATAPLFAADSGSTGTGLRLPRHGFLRVLGGGARRLLVESIDSDGQAGARGWIDPDDIVPSAAGEGWRVAPAPTTLWQAPAMDAPSVRTLDAFTPLLQVDGPVQGRIEVRVYRSDFLRVVAHGWVAADETGPALPPATRVVSGSDSIQRAASTFSRQESFLDVAAEAAVASSQRTGVPASVTVAQAILESDWGRSALSTNAGNYFGMKAIGGLGNDGVIWLPTTEFSSDGAAYETLSPFRAYKTLADSVLDHDLLLRDAPRYAAAMRVAHEPRQFAYKLVEGGYATDPAYADKLIALMDQYDLYRLDYARAS